MVYHTPVTISKCAVYRSENMEETYLYLAIGTKLDDLPPELAKVFGAATPVMMLDLAPDRKLARVDVSKIIDGLHKDGFYLQLPPKFPVEEEISRWIRQPG